MLVSAKDLLILTVTDDRIVDLDNERITTSTRTRYTRNELLQYSNGSSHPNSNSRLYLPDWVPKRNDDLSSTSTSVAHGHSGCCTRSRRKRGKRGGVRRRVIRRGNRPSLPVITLTNIRSVKNKVDELRACCKYLTDYRNSCIICLTETWLDPSVSDSFVEIEGFHLIRHDRNEQSGKSRGGGLCIYVNEKWCKNLKIVNSICDPNIELISISLRPFYLPREFNKLSFVLVYIPPDGDKVIAAETVYETVQGLESSSPDSPVYVLCDVNQCDLKDVLPSHRFDKCVDQPTRGNNILDQCFCSVKEAYKCLIRPPIDQSDHNVVHLFPKYRSKLKSVKPKKVMVKAWSPEAIQRLQDCFDLTIWDVFYEGHDINEATDVINSYILFCEDLHITVKEKKIFGNDKPWFSKNVKAKIRDKHNALTKHDDRALKQATRAVRKAVKEAKSSYRNKLEKCFKSNNPRDAWKCIERMTSYKCAKRDPFKLEEDPKRMADHLNEFYCRFESNEHLGGLADLKAMLQDSDGSPIVIHTWEVANLFHRLNPRKAKGPDGLSGKVLKVCADQLATPFGHLFQQSLDEQMVPSCWKSARITPVAKVSHPSVLNDFRPVALTSLVMKCLEKIVMKHLICDVSDLDPLQFAYQQKKSVSDAVLLLTHLVQQHTDHPGCYARITYMDFSSAFNTMVPALLIPKLINLQVNARLIRWLMDYLHDRKQQVVVSGHLSDVLTTNTGSPQGCVLSPLLFILYTNECRARLLNTFVIKYADDTALVGLIPKDSNDSNYLNCIDEFVAWCDTNCLKLNEAKTKEMIVDYRKRNNVITKIKIHDEEIEQVTTYRYLGTIIDNKLSWEDQTKRSVAKGYQRLHFLRKLKSFHVDQTILKLFYMNVVQSAFLFCYIVWFGALMKKDLTKFHRLVRQAGRVLGIKIDLETEHKGTVISKVKDILMDDNHPLYCNYRWLRSGKRLQSLKSRTNRFLNSFVPLSVRMYNSTP